MRTELKDIIEIDKLVRMLKEPHENGARKELIEYIGNLHDKIRQFDMVNDLIVAHIQRYYKS